MNFFGGDVSIGTAYRNASLTLNGNLTLGGAGNGITSPDSTTQTTAATGTISGVTAGAGLLGGGVTGVVSLAVDPTVVASLTNLAAEATARSAADTLLHTNINNETTARIAGDNTLQAEFAGVPLLSVANTWTANQTVTGNLIANNFLAPTLTAGPAPALMLQGQTVTTATDTVGGDLLLTAGNGTGLGASGNLHLQTAGANDVSDSTANTVVDRVIVVSKGKQLTLSAPGFTSLMSIHLTGTHTAGGRIRYMVRATDGGSQIATEEGVIQYLATANSITCTVQTTDKLHLGTVNSGCTPGFFNPGSPPGVSIFDNVSFSSPAPIVVHEVYFTIENESGAAIRLEPQHTPPGGLD